MADQRRLRLTVGFALVGVLAAIAIAIYQPWRPLRYGRATPPAIPAKGLEPALESFLRERTAAVRATPYSADAWGELGVAYDVHELPEEAILCYERAHRLAPDTFRWIYFLGLCAMPSDHVAAHAHLLAARAIRSDYAPLELHLARGFFDTGDLDRAATHFTRASMLDADLVRPHIGLARIALARDEPEKALRHLQDASARGPTSGEVHFLLAETHRRLGDDEAAARSAERAGGRAAFEEFSDRVRMESQWEVGVTSFWRATRSRAYLESGMVDRAIGEWVAALESDPGSTRPLIELGQIYAGVGDADRAIEAYGRALAIDPLLATVRHRLGLLLFQTGRRDAGLSLVRESCAALPDRADLQSNLARVLAQTGATREAAETFHRAGARYAALRQFARAQDAFENAIKQAPDDPNLTGDLAWLLATCPREDLRDPARARAIVAPLLESERSTARLHDAMAAALAAEGDFPGAVRAAERAMAMTEGSASEERAAIEARLAGYRAGRVFIDR